MGEDHKNEGGARKRLQDYTLEDISRFTVFSTMVTNEALTKKELRMRL